MDPREVASLDWSHVDSVTGLTLHWYQEDEGAVTSRGEAIAVLQRTLNFWLPKMRDDIVKQKGVPVEQAAKMAVETLQFTYRQMRKKEPHSFAARFNISNDDLKWDAVCFIHTNRNRITGAVYLDPSGPKSGLRQAITKYRTPAEAMSELED